MTTDPGVDPNLGGAKEKQRILKYPDSHLLPGWAEGKIHGVMSSDL